MRTIANRHYADVKVHTSVHGGYSAVGVQCDEHGNPIAFAVGDIVEADVPATSDPAGQKIAKRWTVTEVTPATDSKGRRRHTLARTAYLGVDRLIDASK